MSDIIKNILKNPLWLLIYLDKKNLIKLSDKSFLKLKYYLIFGKKLNLKNPTSFNEKLQWLKLYDRVDTYTTLVDKYEVKKYVASIIGEEYIIPTIGIYNNFDEIDFEQMPDSFVIKCTHSGGGYGVIVVKDKKDIDYSLMKKEINECLNTNSFTYGREWPYLNVKPRIIVEKYISPKKGMLNDFKLQTFNGKVAYSFVCTDRSTGNVKFTFFDKNKNFIPVTQGGCPNDPSNAKLPDNYDKFVELSERLAKNLLEARIDFYDVDEKIYFGEITFFDTSGFGKFEPNEWDYKFGEMLDISERINTR